MPLITSFSLKEKELSALLRYGVKCYAVWNGYLVFPLAIAGAG